MRLLRTDTINGDLELVTFDASTPPYAILSHTWITDQEILYQHIQSKDPSIRKLAAYKKVVGCCWAARHDGYDYVWIDTCCIDKSSSAELSEAINSMYKWYRMAEKCYAYLADVPLDEDPQAQAKYSYFQTSRWFTRGWTLQELIAPSVVEFFNADWAFIGSRNGLAEIIENITGIALAVLCGCSPAEVSVATRMSWAARRQTTRIEDKAYSLMGLFGVNMPTIYGEGHRAFSRLQHEIMAVSAEHSILAWTADREFHDETAILANSPSNFTGSQNIVDVPYTHFARLWSLRDAVAGLHREPHGVRAELPVFKSPRASGIDAIAVIACKIVDPDAGRQQSLGLALRRSDPSVHNSYTRVYPTELLDVDCLVDMGVPWSVEPVILMDHVPSVSEELERPESFELIITANTLALLKTQEHFDFVASPPLFGLSKFVKTFHRMPPLELLYVLPMEHQGLRVGLMLYYLFLRSQLILSTRMAIYTLHFLALKKQFKVDA